MRNILTMTALLMTATLAGCLGGAEASSTLYVKDALTDEVAEVRVTFTSAQVEPAEGGWQTVFEGKQTIDLLALSAADAKEALTTMDLAPGEYEGLRIAVSEVEVVHLDGSTELLNVFGNLVQIAETFTVGADGIDILVDFDLDAGVDLDEGTYTPVVKDVQTSDDDSDGDGTDDVHDIDDDNDGQTDDLDEDDDGDGADDTPDQVYADSSEEACAAERDEEIAEAEQERQEAYAEAEQERQENLLSGNATTAQDEYEEDIAEADAEYEEDVAEAEQEYAECLRDDDDHDDEDDDRLVTRVA